MNQDIENKIAKLPKWAREAFANLQYDLERAQRRIEEMTGERETNTHFLVGLEQHALPNHATVRFTLPDGHRIMASMVDNEVRVYCDTGTVRLLPRAANSFAVVGQ